MAGTKVIRAPIDQIDEMEKKGLRIRDVLAIGLKAQAGECPHEPEKIEIPTDKMDYIPKCPRCGVVDNFYRDGVIIKSTGRYQRHLCKKCGRSWHGETLELFHNEGRE